MFDSIGMNLTSLNWVTPANNQPMKPDIVGSCVTIEYELYQYHNNTLKEENFHWNLTFTITPTANSLNL